MQTFTASDLDRCLAGDQFAWRRFVETFSPRIHAVADRVVRSRYPRSGRADVLDASQYVFIRLIQNDFKRLRTWDSARGTLGTWIAVVARSAVLDWVRAASRGDHVSLDEYGDVAEAAVPPHEESLRRSQIPEGLLSPRQTMVMKLIYEEDMDIGDVARTLSVRQQTVRSLKHQAVLKLRSYWGAA